MALLFIISEVAFVAAAVRIDEDAHAVHLISVKIPLIVAAIGPAVLPMALHFVVDERPIVARLVKHHETPLAVAEPVMVLTFKSTVLPLLFALAMLFVVRPSPLVHCVVGADQPACTAPLVSFPLAKIVAAVRVDHASVAILFIFTPIPLVTHSISPDLHASPMPLGADPLT